MSRSCSCAAHPCSDGRHAAAAAGRSALGCSWRSRRLVCGGQPQHSSGARALRRLARGPAVVRVAKAQPWRSSSVTRVCVFGVAAESVAGCWACIARSGVLQWWWRRVQTACVRVCARVRVAQLDRVVCVCQRRITTVACVGDVCWVASHAFVDGAEEGTAALRRVCMLCKGCGGGGCYRGTAKRAEHRALPTSKGKGACAAATRAQPHA
jgi:hypothetical protein